MYRNAVHPRLHGHCWPLIWLPEGASLWPGQPIYTVYYSSGEIAHECFPYGESVWEQMTACFDKTAADNPSWGRTVCVSAWTWSSACLDAPMHVCITVCIHIQHCTKNTCVLSYLQQTQPLFLILAQEMSLLSKLLYLCVIFSSMQECVGVSVGNHNIL